MIPHWVPESTDSTKPCRHYMFSSANITLIEFNLQTRHGKRQTTITNNRKIVTVNSNKSYMNVVTQSI